MNLLHPRNRALAWVEGLLMMASLVGLGVWGAAAHERYRFQKEARHSMVNLETSAELAEGDDDDGVAGAAGAAKPVRQIDPDQPFGTLQIPRLGLDVVIVEGTSDESLDHAVGHLESTPWPGEDGTSAIAGHRDSFFRPLRDIVMADTLVVTTPDGRLEYLVDSLVVVRPDDTALLNQTADDPRLLLITCYPFNFVGPAPSRFIVQARPLPVPAG